jgi:hypothetical protein
MVELIVLGVTDIKGWSKKTVQVTLEIENAQHDHIPSISPKM